MDQEVTRISVSVGAHALPALADALAHAQENPTHDPVVFFEVDPRSQKTWWRCMGARNTFSENPMHLCAHGGDFP